MPSHRQTPSLSQNQKALLANAYNELGKELASSKIRVVGNYTLGKVIGEGAYGKVRLGTHRLTGTRVAIKQIPKAMSAALTREIHHHRQLHHPHITQMYEVIATESSIWIVTELCCGGELFDYLVEKGRLAEEEARVIFGQLCLAVAYLHDHGIVHRDLKLENVLLDEHCRVKLGDFGFTREYDRGSFMETFCGTTGYAAPEMLQGKRYQGPEVDIWSLGVILYCLLTGALPFDDDDELVMRDKIIQGEYEDPIWLSNESRDLIKNILQMDFTKRISIANILAHQWFTAPTLTYDYESPTNAVPPILSPRATTPENRRNSESTAPDSSAHSTNHDSFSQPEVASSTPTTPDDELMSEDPFESSLNNATATSSSPPHTSPSAATSIPRQQSSSTIRKSADLESVSSKLSVPKSGGGNDIPATVIEEDQHMDTNNIDQLNPFPRRHTPSPLPIALVAAGTSKCPPLRTPARTKRRSVSSVLSETGSPTTEKTPMPLPPPLARDLNFANLLNAPAPIIFSTPAERRLLNMLSSLGFNTTQIVHSVLSNACDSAGATWWMLRRKEGERELANASGTGPTAGVDEEGDSTILIASPTELDAPIDREDDIEHHRQRGPHPTSSSPSSKQSPTRKKRTKASIGVQTIPSAVFTSYPYVDNAQVVDVPAAAVAPRFSFIPPTPTFARPSTPPRNVSPTKSPMLSPTSSSNTTSANGEAGSSRSHPSTPGGSLREKDKDKDKGRKPRSGSVSIMQRATTALEAAGLVRKKSTEAVREEKERERERDRQIDRERERSREVDRRGPSGDEPRSSHGSGGSSKLTKSPPLKPSKDNTPPHPSTPPPTEASHYHAHHLHKTSMGSPWVLAEIGTGSAPQLATVTPGSAGPTSSVSASSPSGPGISAVNVKGELLHSQSTPNFPSSALADSGENTPTGPNRAKEPASSATGTATGAATVRGATKPPGPTANRNRANLLHAFRWLFNEERKGKRKDSGDSGKGTTAAAATAAAPNATGTYGRRPVSRRGSSAGKYSTGGGSVAPATGTSQRVSQRPSMSSRRSSSVNSRRSSGTSVQMVVMDSPHGNPSAGGGGRRSFGSHTPNSERGVGGEPFDSSRPSSIKSFSMQGPLPSTSGPQTRTGHRKSPSQSSSGSLNKYHHHSHSHHQFRTASPNVQKFHRRAGSGSSSTRVMRRGQPHARSGSCASSIHSPPSSRPTSFYEPSESEGGGGMTPSSSSYQRTSSPFRTRSTSSSKRTGEEGKHTTATFVQKRQGPFTSPAYTGSVSRSSWKKSWGMEPPGWKSRTAQLPIEVLAISPPGGSSIDPISIRDVFSGKGGPSASGSGSGTGINASLSGGGGDESDWVDEDDDLPPFAGGLGQSGLLSGYAAAGASASTTAAATGAMEVLKPGVVTLSPAPRGHRNMTSSSPAGNGGGAKRNSGRSKAGIAPAGRVSPLPLPDFGYEASRRQMPNARTGTAFKQAIQEEDEEEEEEDF